MSISPPIVDFAGVHKRYGDGPLILDDISFEVARGDFVSLIGPSGCGKSAVATALDTDNIDGISPRLNIADIGRPIVVSADLFGDLHVEVPWWVTQ